MSSAITTPDIYLYSKPSQRKVGKKKPKYKATPQDKERKLSFSKRA